MLVSGKKKKQQQVVFELLVVSDGKSIMEKSAKILLYINYLYKYTYKGLP